MPLYMDRHDLELASPEDVPLSHQIASAHMQDLEFQGQHGVRYLTYWLDDRVNKAFCLVDAPSKERAVAVHREAHGQIPSEIIEVERLVVEGFLGKIEETPAYQDPTTTKTESAFRTILFTDMRASTASTQRLGDARHVEILRIHNEIIRGALREHRGTEVKHTGDGIMASFAAASRAVECAIALQQAFAAYNKKGPDEPIQIKVGASAGEPVAEDKDLFGATVQLAARLRDKAKADQILVAGVIRDLCLGKDLEFADLGEAKLKGFKQPVRICEVRWR
jgi:class 3 adenylate cyclase